MSVHIISLIMALRDVLAGIEPESIPYPMSRVYRALTGTSLFQDFYRIVARQVIEKMHAGRVLDIGTGPGRLPIILASESPLLLVTGLDLSIDMVKIAAQEAQKRGLKNVVFRQGSASDLPFPDTEFNLVVSTLSFHHWKQPEQALDEIYRVLREGGEAWIYDIPRKMDRTAWAYLKRSYGLPEGVDVPAARVRGAVLPYGRGRTAGGGVRDSSEQALRRDQDVDCIQARYGTNEM